MKASRRKPKPLTVKQKAALNLEKVQAEIAKLQARLILHQHYESMLLASLETSKWDKFCKWFWDITT